MRRICVPHVDLGFRRCASRNVLLPGSGCIERFLLFLGRSSSLLHYWLVSLRQRIGRLWIGRITMRSVSFGVLLRVRSGIRLLVQRVRRRAGFRRTAVGLMPLGCTSNDW